ncbi:MAG: hypothetical protein ACT4OV_02290 [Microthrixaceae bacterium]
MTARRPRRWPWLVLGAVGIASFGAGIAGASVGATDAVVNGLDAVAFSGGVGQTFGDPNAQPYPVAKGDIAHTEATLSAGPTGYALASTAWPGPLVANAGSLAVLLGAPPEAGQANYSGRAEAFSGGPNDAELAGMKAHAKDGVAEATAGAQDFESAPGASTGDVYTRSYSSFDAGTLQSVSSCTASDLGFADGAVTIGSVHTDAQATTNGASSDAGGRTVVTGTKIGGQDAEVDENGVRFTDPATAPIGEQILSNFGISMFVAAPRQEESASSASHRAGSLVVIWDPPGTDYGYIYEICGSDAAVALRTGLGFVPPVLPPGPTTPPVDGGGVPVYVPPSSGPSFEPPAAAPPATTASTVPSIEPAPIAFVRDLSLWPYVLGIAFVVAAGLGLASARERALQPRAALVTCPLEGAGS